MPNTKNPAHLSSTSELREIRPGVFAHATALIDAGAVIGAGTRIWHFSHVMSGAHIGRDCSFGQGCFIASGTAVGHRVKVQNQVSIYEGVEIEDDVFLGPSMVFTNVLNPRSAVVRRHEYRRTRVSRGATVGANATVLPGVVLGEYCFVGAGAAVTRDVPPFALVVGVPARQRGWMSRHGERLSVDDRGRACCPVTGELYELQGSELTLLATPAAPPPPARDG